MNSYQTSGCNRFGASMGRSSDLPFDTTGALQIRRVPIDNQGYDPGGAYWGTGVALWCVTGDEGDYFTRSPNSAGVKVRFPNASWVVDTTKGDIADMVQAYIEAALWSTTDESNDSGGDPLDDNYGPKDFSAETLAKAQADCEVMADVILSNMVGEIDWQHAGYDFWFTRNGHGCGFRDGDWPEPVATIFYEASKGFAEVYLYVSDTGEVCS
jgi:hypothetical protein